MLQVTLKIDGMRCGMCEAHVADAIRHALPQAKKVKANHHKGQVSFLIEEGVDYAPAKTKIEAGGYRVLVEENAPAKKGFFSH